MSAFFAEYGLFLLKAVTIVVAIIAVIGFAAASRKGAHEGLEVESINKKHKELAASLRKAVLQKDEQKKD